MKSYKVSYIHELPNWPKLTWDQERLASRLAAVHLRQGRLLGRMEALGFKLREEAVLQTLTIDVLKSSEIEGEFLNPEQVRSSVARHLGIDVGKKIHVDRHVEGTVDMMLDATQNFEAPLTSERLFGWHAALFPTGHSGLHKIIVGQWRDDSKGRMQVVSGPISKEKVHFIAPKSNKLKSEMSAFIKWANKKNDVDPILRSALLHFWFVTIHPFDDGNGRIARAIADWALAQSENSSQRFYSMSSQIRLERETYYDILEKTQKGSLDITDWMIWFLECLERALSGTEVTLADVFRKTKFWEKYVNKKFNDRQRLVLNKLLDGFEGKLTSSKWAKLAKCSQDTSQRDIQSLIEQKILKKDEAGGRSTSYSLVD